MRHAQHTESSRAPATAAVPAKAARSSLRGRLLNLMLDLVVRRPLARRELHELPATRARLDRMGTRLPVAPNVLREQATLGQVPVEWTRIAGVSDPRRTVLYLHGGAFLLGSPRMYRGLTADLARATAADVVAIDYRLAPEHPFPAALDDAAQAYAGLIASRPAAQVVVMGDSAGGNLTLALLQRLRDAGTPMPAGAVTFSPWLDLGAEYTPDHLRIARDPMLPAERIREAAGHYHGAVDPAHPLVSPLHLDFAGLPPLLVQAGERELLLPALRTFAARGRAHGAPLEFRVWPNMPHVFQAFARYLPEAREALVDVGAFVQRLVPAAVSGAATAADAPAASLAPARRAEDGR
jgi:monoterpene epsilon-lactone hydrolase